MCILQNWSNVYPPPSHPRGSFHSQRYCFSTSVAPVQTVVSLSCHVTICEIAVVDLSHFFAFYTQKLYFATSVPLCRYRCQIFIKISADVISQFLFVCFCILYFHLRKFRANLLPQVCPCA